MAAGGHSIHSHGYTHTSAFQLSDEDWLQEMRQVEEETAGALVPRCYSDSARSQLSHGTDAGVCARPILYRPPFGAHSARTDVLARNIGYRVVMWSLDTQDWQNAESSPQAVISRVNALLQTSVR